MARLAAVVSALGLSALAAAQTTSTAFTDETTGITFQKYSGEAGGYGFALALPAETSSTDFIGQISGDSTATWAGVSLTGQMTNSLLIVAFPNADNTAVLGSLRKATAYTNPSVVTDSGTLTPIAKGTVASADGWTYTFLCKGCLADAETSFDATGTDSAMGLALSTNALQDASSAGAVLNSHSETGGFGINLESARSSDFDTWAAMASSDTPTSGGSSSGNSTTGGAASGNGTATPAGPATVSNETWDYIVAGGGPAGLIVATRFAEAGHSVLLLERGMASLASSGGQFPLAWNDSLTPMDVPGLAFHVYNMPGTSSAFCNDIAGMGGCLLGGGSAVNGLQWFKPGQRDFDDKWPSGWQWSDMSVAAERVYERNPGTIRSSADGELYDQAAFDQVTKFLDAHGYSSVNALEDPDAKDMVYSHTPYNALDGRRAGAVRTYLPIAQELSNFKLQLNSTVLRVIREGSTATGVEVLLADNSRQIVNLNDGGKVVLASGALSTPRILFRSGIGPKEQIQAVQSGSTSITLPPESDWIELPVGKYVQDHPNFFVTLSAVNNQSDSLATLTEEDFMNPSQENIDLFNVRAGPLTQGNGRLDFFTKITDEESGTDRYFQTTGLSSAPGSITLIVALTHGLDSTGELGLTSQGTTEFTTTPWLNTDGDKAAVTAFMERLLEYTRSPGSNLVPTKGLNVTADELAGKSGSTVHFVGSCRIGEDDGRQDGGKAVVDLDAKVYGTDNLYIVDASIHPDLPTGNTQAPVMVVAERAAALIVGSEDAGTGAQTSGGETTSDGNTSAAADETDVSSGVVTNGGSNGSSSGSSTGSSAGASTEYPTGTRPKKTNCKRGRRARRGMRLSPRS